MAHHDLEIAVDKKGSFTGPPLLHHVEIGDTVSWHNRNGKSFQVVFPTTSGSPFDPPVFSVSDPGKKCNAKNNGRYKYAVSALDDDDKTHGVHACPELEVDN